jgi:hypothetical protein
MQKPFGPSLLELTFPVLGKVTPSTGSGRTALFRMS